MIETFNQINRIYILFIRFNFVSLLCNKKQTNKQTNNKQQTTNNKQQTTNNKQQTTNNQTNKQQTTNFKFLQT